MSSVDSHAHVFSATAPAVTGARYRPNYAARLTAWRALWEQAGITHGVLVQPSFFGTNNAEMLAAIASDPTHLRGVAVVDPSISDGALLRLEAAGIRAIRLNLRGATDLEPYAATRWHSLFRRVHALGWHVEVFVDAGGLPGIAAALAGTEVAVVFDHFGVPGHDKASVDATFGAATTLAAERSVWCKLSASYRLGGGDPRVLAARWLAVVGPQRLVWGSDWPWTQHERGNDYLRVREALDRWVGGHLAPGILWDNAARLYHFA